MSTRFTALTIKEGDAFLLEDNGWNCLFDSGKDKSIIDLLKYKGIDKLDLAICSHNDIDHAQGFIELLESGFQIDEIWLPGLWASILQYVKDNFTKRNEIECYDEDYGKILDSFFSEESENSKESESLESVKETLYFFKKYQDTKRHGLIYPYFHRIIVDYLVENSTILADIFIHGLEYPLIEYLSESEYKDYIEDYYNEFFNNTFDGYPHLFMIKNYKDYKPHKLSRMEILGLMEDVKKHKFCVPNELSYMMKRSLDFKLARIMNIAVLALQCGCNIRWFEPKGTCVNYNQFIECGFLALNSKEMARVKKLWSPMAYFCALSLSNENRFSLVFEYWKRRRPIVRFSADSKITCQSQSPYKENIIVTAPHHGSAANANVYRAIHGNDIIWVRSDKHYNKRPCSEFKKLRNKYCLSCKTYNFISELSFEYDAWHQKWQHIRGEQCRCK